MFRPSKFGSLLVGYKQKADLIILLCSQALPSLPWAFSAQCFSNLIIFKLCNHLPAPTNGAVSALSCYHLDYCEVQANAAEDVLLYWPPKKTFEVRFYQALYSRVSHFWASYIRASPSDLGFHSFELCALEPHILSLTFPSSILMFLSLIFSNLALTSHSSDVTLRASLFLSLALMFLSLALTFSEPYSHVLKPNFLSLNFTSLGPPF